MNREAARRLRERRQESLDSAQDKVSHLQCWREVHHAVLCCHVLPWLITYIMPACSARLAPNLSQEHRALFASDMIQP